MVHSLYHKPSRMEAGICHEKFPIKKGAVKKWKSFLHSPFSMASFSVNDSQLPAGIVISSGGTRRYGAKILGSNETQSREISCHHGLATFRSEISPLRFASVEMTRVSQPLFPYLAKSVALISRITTTLTCPGYCSSFSILAAISWARMVDWSSDTFSGFTMTLSSRPAWMA